MNHASLVREAAERSGLSEAAVAAVVDALASLVHDSHVTPGELVHALLGAGGPLPPPDLDPRDPAVVTELVERAKAHPLGLDYLRSGHLGSVAVTFETHAFTVLAARDLLR